MTHDIERIQALGALADQHVLPRHMPKPPAQLPAAPEVPEYAQTFAPLEPSEWEAVPTPQATPTTPAVQRNANDGVVLRCGADMESVPVVWLWKYWLAIGKLHILAGAPGQGKTTIAMAAAATVTIGGKWPDGSRCEAGNVLIWSGEDDPADTLLPRLLAAGADKSRCYFIEATRRDGDVVPFDPARDLPQLQAAIEQIGGIKLLIVDPVVSAVTGDSHKNTEVRRALQPLVDMGAACGCAVLGITHFAKGGQGTDPAQRVVGSVAFTAVARVVLVAAKVKGKDGEDARILARGKSNIGPDDGGFEYHLEQAEPIPGIQASRIAWGKAVEGSARELLTDPEDQTANEAMNVAGFLRGLLSDGPLSAKAIYKDADGAGYSRDQIKRASLKLGIEKTKEGMGGGWLWRLPSHPQREHEGSEERTFRNTLPSHSSALPSANSGGDEWMEITV
ncbi:MULTISPECIES: AAA family ATPase [Giesbergeria]|uniref:AAA family ATPase n=1 Tax=Giesbergeria sinuosa TaxID=80883 RepID=A0ABV9QGZ7_9BURK